jgi:hypothetical protein
MGLVSGTIKNIFGGVSQFPAEQRDESQFAEQINALPIFGKKLGRRPPSLHVAKLNAANLSGSFECKLGDYTILVLGGVVRIFDTLTGVEQAVTNNVTWGYLTGGTLKSVSIGDTAFLLNTAKVTAKAPAVVPNAPFRAHVSVLAGDYETTYTVSVAGVAYSTTTPAAGGAGAKAAITTSAIATALKVLIDAGAGIDATAYGSTIYVRRTDGADFTISTTDGLADKGLRLIKLTAKQFADLPAKSEPGTIVEIVGELGTGVDNYFVKSVASDGFSLVADTWQEAPKPGSQYVIDSLTMPVSVVQTGVGAFTVDVCPWEDRGSGEDTTNPFPSFLGSTVADIFIYQGRLGFLAGENIVLSRSGDYYNLFRKTVTQILADDPIDVSGSISGVTSLDWALDFNEGLYLFASGKAQYLLSGDSNGLTSSTVSLTKVSEYRYDTTVRPIAAGQRAFFVAQESGVPRIMDFHLKGYQKVHEATDIGRHVPTYFAGTARSLVADDAQGILLFLTSTGLYCYNYLMDEESRRVQGAWSSWTFGSGAVLAIGLNDGVVSLVQGYTDGTFLNIILLDPARLAIFEGFDTFDGSDGFVGITFYDGGPASITETPLPAHLDRYIDSTNAALTVTFDGTKTVWTLPYDVALNGSQGTLAVTGANPGVFLATTRAASNTIQAVGNYTGVVTRVGVRYDTVETLSTLYLRDRNTSSAELRGRLQLRWLRVHYVDSNALSVVVTQAGRTARTYSVTSAFPQSGVLLVPIQGRTEDIIVAVHASSAGGDAITGFDWEGTYHTRSARI